MATHLVDIRKRLPARILAGSLLVASLAVSNLTPAHAANYTALANQISKAVDATSGNRMTLDMVSAGTTIHMSVVAIRRGAHPGTYLQVATKTGTTSHTNELVTTAKRLCYRQQQAWSCTPTKDSSLGDVYGSLNNPFKILATESKLPSGEQVQITSAGTKSVQGQTSIGFTFSIKGPKTSSPAIAQIWIAIASSLPVEEDTTVTGKSPLKFTAVWSHWNDSSLSLPALPA